jgi:hypothetical protein
MTNGTIAFVVGIDPDASGISLARMDIPFSHLETDIDPETGAHMVGFADFRAELSGVACPDAVGFFSDNYIGVGFYGPDAHHDAIGEFGDIFCTENSTGTDCGIEIYVRAKGLVPVVTELIGTAIGFDPDRQTIAVLRIWFPLYERDGEDHQRLIDNMLNGPGRPLLRVELWSKRAS